MKIHSLQLQNFRCFKELSATFEDDLTVLVARNGQGKSTLLDALKIALWPYISGFDLGNQTNTQMNIDINDVCRQLTPDGNMEPILDSSIKIHLSLGNKDIHEIRYRNSIDKRSKTRDSNGTSKLKKEAKKIQKSIFSGDTATSQIKLPIVGYYGTGRLWNLRKLMSEKNDVDRRSRTFGYRGCLDPSSTFKYFAEWYTNIFKSYRDAQIIELEKNIDNSEEINKRRIPISVVQESINGILEKHTGWKDIRYATQESTLTLSNETHGVLSVDQLSDGIRNIFGVVADIAYRCLLLNPGLGGNAARETAGIILIDEIDMHLHPAWQQTILSDLHRVFPRIQFVVTTHSPQILSSITPRNIRILQDGNVVMPGTSTYGAESNRILEEIFGVTSRPDKLESTIILNRYFAAINAGGYNSEQAVEDREKLDVWLHGDPVLDTADMLIQRAERKRMREAGRA